MITENLERCYAGGWVTKAPSDDYWYMGRGQETVAGVEITEDIAMQFADVFACVNKISKTHATLPIQVYERTDQRTRQPVDHPLNDLLMSEANAEATGVTLRETILSDILRWGHAFVFVDWAPGQFQREPRTLTVLPAGYMDYPSRDAETGELQFVYRGGARAEPIPLEHMWYIPGLSFNGITGISPIQYNRESIALGRVSTQFRSAFFGNGAWAGGFITRPMDAPDLSPEAGQALIDALNEKFRGASKAFGFGLLREGMDFKQLNMPFEDAMFLGTARLTRMQICGIFDVPLSKIQDDERNTMKNAEQNDITWAKDCLLPWSVRIEASARKRFFRNSKLYLRFNLAGVMRGEFKARMEGYNIGMNWGLWSINEVRALEDANPIEGGDVHFRPLNMGILGEPDARMIGQDQAYLPRETVTQNADLIGGRICLEQMQKQVAQIGTAIEHLVEQRPDPLAAFQPTIQHAAEKIVTRQCKATEQAFRKHAKGGTEDTFKAWAEEFFENHAAIVRAEIEPILCGVEKVVGHRLRCTAQDLADEYCDQCFDTLMAAFTEKSLGVLSILKDWQEHLAIGIVERVMILITEKEADRALPK